MIVPNIRLLWWVGLLLPAFAISVVAPIANILAQGLAGLLLIVAVLDAALSLSKLDGLRIDCPELVRLSRNRGGGFDMGISGNKHQLRILRLGLKFPFEITAPGNDMTVELPAEAQRSSVHWELTGLKRGRYHLDLCYIETPSVLGFWSIRGTREIETEIRVHPNLMAEGRDVAALFLRRGVMGLHSQRQIGKGRDFEQLREYQSGDGYEDIHWKATAKRGRPVTKVFQIERTQEVYVIVDASRLSARPTRRPAGYPSPDPQSEETFPLTVLERFAAASLIVGLAAERQGDLFGLIAFSDRVKSFVRAKNGRAHYGACREVLTTLQPQLVSPDYHEIFAFIATRLRRRALLIFLTSLDDPVLAEHFADNIPLIARRHLVLTGMIQPHLARPAFSNPDLETMDDVYKDLGGHLLWTELKQTEKVLRRKNVPFVLLPSETMCAELVTQYVNVKKRQIL